MESATAGRPDGATARGHGALGRLVLAATGGALAGGVAALTAAALLARQVVSAEEGERPDDVEVLGVGSGTVTLRATPHTLAPGRYGLWLDADGGHARLGDVVDHDEQAGTVTRLLAGVDRGRLRPGSARWNQYYYAGDPATALGLAFESVHVSSRGGLLPAWQVPAREGARSDRWAVLVHGRGASREETLRTLPLLHRLGLPSLAVSYRNDPDVVPADDVEAARRHYHLGESEWLDVEAAVIHALQAGARDVVLVGWSMGGAIALQMLDRSWTADRVRGVVLDAPVVDWRDVLDHHARVNRVPVTVGRAAQWIISHAHARRLVGLEMPLPLRRMDWVARAGELTVPMLVLHSDDDEFVPSGPSRRLAAARPDLVHLVSSRHALHTAEWNVDPLAWERAVARFLLDL